MSRMCQKQQSCKPKRVPSPLHTNSTSVNDLYQALLQTQLGDHASSHGDNSCESNCGDDVTNPGGSPHLFTLRSIGWVATPLYTEPKVQYRFYSYQLQTQAGSQTSSHSAQTDVLLGTDYRLQLLAGAQASSDSESLLYCITADKLQTPSGRFATSDLIYVENNLPVYVGCKPSRVATPLHTSMKLEEQQNNPELQTQPGRHASLHSKYWNSYPGSALVTNPAGSPHLFTRH
jgi:hypothetical protein